MVRHFFRIAFRYFWRNIACMGLYGLASFSAESRTKEIGIRKCNGATILSIIYLLQNRFARWLLISVCIAVPVALQLGVMFLGKFYFHASFPIWTLLAGPLLAILIASTTVISVSWKAATQNPVKSLRYE